MQSKAYPRPGTLARLDRQRRALGITLERIAVEAAKTTRRKRRTVGITTVSNVFAGRTKSANVVETARRLVLEASTTTNGESATPPTAERPGRL